jgi:RimJ/RimL family protein N-acetyltransferase
MGSLPYDINFCFAAPDALENDRVKLVPFIPHVHAEGFFAKVESCPQLFDYLPYGPFNTIEELNGLLESRIRQDPASLLFVVYDKTNAVCGSTNNDGLLAGCIGFLNSSAENLAVEIGHIVTLPAFQRTHVTSNAIGLLLHYALDPPSAGGLGLRRVAWQSNALNGKSVKAARRMGFKMEGILRWDRALPPGKEEASNGKGERTGDPMPGYVGRDTAMLSLCWDDWEGGAREHVDETMARAT